MKEKPERKKTANVAEPTEAQSYSAAGLALVAGAVAKARALPAPHAFASSHGPEGYRDVAKVLRDRVEALIQTLAGNPTSANLEEANDRLLERLDRDLALLGGKPAPPERNPQAFKITKDPVGQQKNVPRPQLLFKDGADNDRKTLWVPKIKEKPNSIRELKLEQIFDEDGKAVGYAHPYSDEIEAYAPPKAFLVSKINPEIKLKDKSSTKLTYIDTEDQLNSFLLHLDSVDEIAVDAEHHSYRSFQGITCLLQISTEAGGDFIIDAIALREHLHGLNKAFTDPRILKVFHGADSDVLWLQRDFGVYVVGMFDTHQAAIRLGLPNRSLKALTMRYCNESQDKTLQLADWRVRPLTKALIEYARSDTHGLLYVWRRMRRELLDQTEGKPDVLTEVFKASQNVAKKTYKKPVFDDNAHFEFSAKCRKMFNSRQMSALKSLFEWRDSVAREEDESLGYVLPNHMLLEIAITLPRETSGVLACCKPTPPLLLQHLNEVHKLVQSAREEPLTNVVQNQQLEPEPASFSLASYDRQILNDSIEKLSITDESAYSIPEPIPSRSSLFSSAPKVDSNITAKCFIPPFERYKLIKQYNEANPPKVPEVKPHPIGATKHALTETLTLTKVGGVTDKIPFTPSEEPPKKKKRVEDGDPEFIHKFRKPEKRKHNDNDDKFESFDYKSYNYNVFNKDPNANRKKKNKFRKK